ncbi:MAG: YbhB/YbcL family Raf kinase inhibitor-like protein [Nanoarchaeota archaeon]|nr:YbhB/YbcL family Raf kinase inhibitor-like protein [Nanoarchaeota archaeon]
MKLTSSAFAEGGKIPSKYTCDGANTNPPLTFSDVPAKAKSLVLIMDDPDIPDFAKEKFKVQVWDHWVVFNIPPETKEVSEGKNPSGVLGRNTGGKNAYGGPCPPDREHRYFFKLYALDTELPLPEGSTKAEVEKAMKNHILTEAKLMGRYERIKK